MTRLRVEVWGLPGTRHSSLSQVVRVLKLVKVVYAMSNSRGIALHNTSDDRQIKICSSGNALDSNPHLPWCYHLYSSKSPPLRSKYAVMKNTDGMWLRTTTERSDGEGHSALIIETYALLFSLYAPLLVSDVTTGARCVGRG